VPASELPSGQQFCSFDGLELSYYVAGDGPPVLLLHGFGSSSEGNWFRPGVAAALVGSGRQVVALDARGHGRSAKPHDPAAYAGGAMVRDAAALVDHLGLEALDVCGYSMGGLTARAFVGSDPRPRSAVLGGIGERVTGTAWRKRASAVAAALLAEDPTTITEPVPRAFRQFVDYSGVDRRALAAVQQAPGRGALSPGPITVPTLVLVGERDVLAGSPEGLAAAIGGARIRRVPGDHLSAVLDPAFARAIVDFLPEVASG
jgi:pimeloyl-ACP methyl ester carboxylesterase